MKIFEEMKAALEGQVTSSEQYENNEKNKIIVSPFQPGDCVTYRVPVIVKEPSRYTWQEHHGVVLAVSPFAELVLIQPEDEPETPWRWLWWGYVKRMSDAQE